MLPLPPFRSPFHCAFAVRFMTSACQIGFWGPTAGPAPLVGCSTGILGNKRIPFVANRRIEDQLDALSSLRGSSPAVAAPALRKALNDRVNLVAAKAANVAAALPAPELVPDLLRAFDRLFIDPLKTDPQCWGKNAIALALRDLGHRDSAAYLRGAVHIQLEPVWGRSEDTAGPLRGHCLHAL